jgi:S-DNA-T family DNA segregation ATPase FtsK/SpoIIIE
MKRLSLFLKSVIFLSLALITLLSLFSYSKEDIGLLSYKHEPTGLVSVSKTTQNFIGVVGAYLAFLLLFVFGYAAYFLPFFFFFLGLAQLDKVRFYGLGKNKVINTVSFIFFITFLSALIGVFFKYETAEDKKLAFQFSGLLGSHLAHFFNKYLGFTGSLISFLLILVVSAILLFGCLFLDLLVLIKTTIAKLLAKFKELRERKKEEPLKKKIIKPEELKQKTLDKRGKPEIKPEIKVYTPQVTTVSKDSILSKEALIKDKEKLVDKKEEIKKKVESSESQPEKKFDPKTYKLPSIDILKVPPLLDYREVKENIEANIKNLEETLSDFGVEAKVVSVQKGPVVTMYELQPSPGVKIQKISALADDIALAMKSSSVRVVAPIPGRGTVGIEVPNEKKHIVYLREVLEDKAFINASSKLTLAIGKDVSGNPVVADLKEMPHLLIAGTTGSGKTICVNSIITSILFKMKPDEVKFILIDPKMVELTIFSGIPHLLHPIISEAKKAFIALSWAVEEMEKRYQLLAEEGARNIDAYNKGNKKMHHIVIVIDELADLMVVARESIETAIQRLAQLSRAVGIHLILATQRPSVDVITGVIKANFPARISFKVSSKVDSRTVLDMMGAEKLLGKGDLLFLKPGAPKLIRAQGSFVDDEDIENVINFIKTQGGPVYEEGIVEGEKKAAMSVEEDELFDEAVKVILQARQASASILQRRMRVGYTRAARLLDLMEQQAIVGPFCGSKAREILVDPETYLKEKGWS